MNSLLSSSLVYTSSSNPFYNADFRKMLDPHLHWLKTAGNVRHNVQVPSSYMGAFIGDFYAVLTVLGIQPKFHRIVMLINGLTNPVQYDGQITELTIPDVDLMDSILMVYNTGRSKLLNGVPGM